MKPIIVHYIDVGNMASLDVAPYIEQVTNVCHYDGEYHSIFLPVRGQGSKVECLNPTVVENEKERIKITNSINQLAYSAKEIMIRMPYLVRNGRLLTERM